MKGTWCLHCERCWHGERLKRCPARDCDGGLADMWAIEGDFEHGEHVALYGDPKFEQLRKGRM